MIRFFLGVIVSVMLSCISIFAQDDNSSSINSYDNSGSSLGAPAEEPPVKKKAPVASKNIPPAQSDDNNGGPATTGDDDHYIQSDDYFIMTEPFDSETWSWVSLAKMTTPPTADSKKEAEFLTIKDGNKTWTKYYYKTVIEKKSNFKLGEVVIGFDSNRDDNGIYHAPESKESARGGSWWIGKITDTSDLYKGYVTIAGNYKIAVNNLRISIR